MKSYHITDELYISLQESGLTFELDGSVITGIDDSFVAKALDTLIGITFNPNALIVRKSINFENNDRQSLELIFRHPLSEEYSLDLVIYQNDEIEKVVTIKDRWALIMLMTVLTKLLPSLCEGAV